MSTSGRVLEQLRQPEYTGENRCMPCTAVNLVIAGMLAIGIAIVSVVAGIAAFGLFAGAIYFRGYLVPGTPTITQQYFPEPVLRAFGKDVEAEPPIEQMDTDPESIETLLVEANVVEECNEEDDLCLTAQFKDTWWRRIRQLRDDDQRAAERLAHVLEIDPAELSFENDTEFTVRYEDAVIGRWDSDAMFYADLAAEPTLGEYVHGWEELEGQQRTQLLVGLRAFLTECPACDAPLDPVEDVRRSCCSGSYVSVTVRCEQCDAIVFSGSEKQQQPT